MTNNVNKCFVGIDVSKDKIDICVIPHNKSWTQSNSKFNALVKKLSKYKPALIPTGGYELGVFNSLTEAGFRVSREHAYKIHHHAKAMGKLAKTDKIDAGVIAHYAQCHCEKIEVTRVTKQQLLLSDLVSRRNQLIKMQTQEKNRLEKKDYSSQIQRSIKIILKTVQKEIERVDTKINNLIDSDEELKNKKEIVQTVMGIGNRVSTVIVAKLPELGRVDRKKIAALVGVAPYSKESGKLKRIQKTMGGRFEVRSALFMSTLSAIRHDSRFKNYYEKLIQKGKKKKVAIVACLHKMLRILNAMLANNESYKSA
ncbi:MAG: IS110 family transposase [Thermodesulfobacteriota bacterium]